MTEKRTKFNIIINNIEFKMIRKDNYCWIKVDPLIRVSIPASLHLILNDECHHWDIYDENGREAHKIYFEGVNSTPSFYLKSRENCYRIDCDNDNIKVIPITKSHNIESYLKKYCYCISTRASCWAKAIYYTSRPDKPPFDEM